MEFLVCFTQKLKFLITLILKDEILIDEFFGVAPSRLAFGRPPGITSQKAMLFVPPKPGLRSRTYNVTPFFPLTGSKNGGP
ncbi:hypothetical protein MRY82_00800 [bacterium]|nr:hypothetical protein [bacterium]